MLSSTLIVCHSKSLLQSALRCTFNGNIDLIDTLVPQLFGSSEESEICFGVGVKVELGVFPRWGSGNCVQYEGGQYLKTTFSVRVG